MKSLKEGEEFRKTGVPTKKRLTEASHKHVVKCSNKLGTLIFMEGIYNINHLK
jgi:hypothetical protein